MHEQFRIGLPKMHGRNRIGLPEVHWRFCKDPPKWYMVLYGTTSNVPLNILPLDFHSLGILLTIVIMQEKQQNTLFEVN